MSDQLPRVEVRYQQGSGTQEILRPTLVCVNGRNYRKLTEVAFGKRRKEEEGEGLVRGGRPHFTDDVYDEGEDLTVELEGVERTPGGGFLLRLPTPSVFFKYIIGREGRTTNSIESDTRCRLRIPGRGREGDIMIDGPTTSAIAEAKRRIGIICWANRLKEPVTHFISIPLNNPAIMERFEAFKKAVMGIRQNDRGIVPAVFQDPELFHLTVGVMRLFSAEEVERAKDVLKECVAKAVPCLGTEPATISLKGVACMKDDPSNVDVLYAKVFLTDNSSRLQEFVDALVAHFLERAPDLMNREFEREGVKLHATVMNSAFSSQLSEQSASSGRPENRGYRRPRESFDARGIFRELGEFHFGEVPLETVHLSKRGECGPNGYYKCIMDYSLMES